MLTLLLTRHGLTPAGDAILGGQLDVPLAPEGRVQAEALTRRLACVRIDRVVSSPMLRALETAQTLAAGRPVEVDERLRELDYGRWEGLTYAEVEAHDPELRARWEHDPAETHSPEGESGDDVAARALSFLVDLLEAELGEAPSSPMSGRHSPDPGGSRRPSSEAQAQAEGERRVLLVAHGTFNRILMCVALGAATGAASSRIERTSRCFATSAATHPTALSWFWPTMSATCAVRASRPGARPDRA